MRIPNANCGDLNGLGTSRQRGMSVLWSRCRATLIEGRKMDRGTPEEVASGDELMDVRETCAFFGHISASTLHRGVRDGTYPKPVKMGRAANRWLRSECRDAMRALMERRDRAA